MQVRPLQGFEGVTVTHELPGKPVIVHVQTRCDIDYLERYLEFVFKNDAGKAAGSYVLGAVAFFRCARLKDLKLVRAKATLTGWIIAEPDRSKLPLPRSFDVSSREHHRTFAAQQSSYKPTASGSRGAAGSSKDAYCWDFSCLDLSSDAFTEMRPRCQCIAIAHIARLEVIDTSVSRTVEPGYMPNVWRLGAPPCAIGVMLSTAAVITETTVAFRHHGASLHSFALGHFGCSPNR